MWKDSRKHLLRARVKVATKQSVRSGSTWHSCYFQCVYAAQNHSPPFLWCFQGLGQISMKYVRWQRSQTFQYRSVNLRPLWWDHCLVANTMPSSSNNLRLDSVSLSLIWKSVKVMKDSTGNDNIGFKTNLDRNSDYNYHFLMVPWAASVPYVLG